MNIKRLDHLNLTVKNFEESAIWYHRVFGFDVVERGVQRGRPWGVLRASSAMLCIYEHPELEAPKRRGDLKQHGLSHFALAIDDPDAWRRTVKEQDIELNWGGEINWPYSTAWYVSDPTGYEIEIAYWKGDIRF